MTTNMNLESITEEIHAETGLTGSLLMERVFAVGYILALMAGNDEAAKHFNARYVETQNPVWVNPSAHYVNA